MEISNLVVLNIFTSMQEIPMQDYCDGIASKRTLAKLQMQNFQRQHTILLLKITVIQSTK